MKYPQLLKTINSDLINDSNNDITIINNEILYKILILDFFLRLKIKTKIYHYLKILYNIILTNCSFELNNLYKTLNKSYMEKSFYHNYFF